MPKKLKLLQTHKITFTRHGSDSDSDRPFPNEYGEIVTTVQTTEIETCGSLQPFSKKNNRVGLEEGFREEDFLVYYTTADLRTTKQFTNKLPDTCVIDGDKYKITRKGKWDGFGLCSDHYEYYLQLVQPEGS